MLALLLASCRVQGVAPARRTPPAGTGPRVLLAPDGLETARFGASPDVVVDMLRASLGREDDDTGWVDPSTAYGTCPGSVVRAVRWKRLRVLFSDGPTEVAERGTRHFFSYVLLATNDARPLDARTAEGIGLGSTLAEVRRAYEGALRETTIDPPGPGSMRFDLPSADDRARVSGVTAGAPACGK